KVAVLTGGVGGARFLRGIVDAVDPASVTAIVNADVPCVVPDDLQSLLAATPLGGIALVASADGRTNALSLPDPNVFDPLYGPRSAKRFQRAARDLGLEAVAVAIPNLVDDVDTPEDLDRLQLRAGPHTQAALQALTLAS
ncbi:MAG TPA: hypothetical protein VF225_01025, partial [Gaiellaceae bacterium]